MIAQKTGALSMTTIRVACSVALAAMVWTQTASADITVKKSMWGPASVGGQSQFPIYEDLGVGIWQHTLSWREIAATRPAAPRDPADPAYRWPSIDAALADAEARGIAVSLLVLRTPAWANGGRSQAHAPRRAEDLAQFMAAASRRYPTVRYWMVWSEPTKPTNFRPLRNVRRAARTYARMLDRSYAALKRVDPRDRVIGGNSFTVGTIRPRAWIRHLQLPGGRPPRMDLYGHNAFTRRRPLLSPPPLGRGFADFGDLDTLFRWLDRDLRGARPDGRPLRVFISEISFPTGHPNHEFNFFMTEELQARWMADALRETRRTPRIATFGYLGLFDDALRPGGDQVERGLIRRDGTRKPAYAAFRDG